MGLYLVFCLIAADTDDTAILFGVTLLVVNSIYGPLTVGTPSGDHFTSLYLADVFGLLKLLKNPLLINKLGFVVFEFAFLVIYLVAL